MAVPDHQPSWNNWCIPPRKNKNPYDHKIVYTHMIGTMSKGILAPKMSQNRLPAFRFLVHVVHKLFEDLVYSD
jgi:hypothetical protein